MMAAFVATIVVIVADPLESYLIAVNGTF